MKHLTEDERRRIRIDFLKIKQKVLNMYPLNSVERTNLVKQEQLRELRELTISQNLIKTPEIEMSVKELCKINQRDIYRLFGWTMFTVVGIIAFFVSTSIFQTLISGLIFTYGLLRVLGVSFDIWRTQLLVNTHGIVTKTLQDKIIKLKNDLL